MRTGTIIKLVAGLFVTTILCFAAVAQDTACGKPMTLEQKVQRSLDIQEVQNVASMHEYYHNAWAHGDEIRNIWAQKTPGVTWTNNTDKYIGMASLKKFYVDNAKTLPTVGVLAYHMLTTPVIEIAGDGKTAKAVWMSFGEVSGPMGGKGAAAWTQEKYGMDFVKEDGKWKIWHLRTYVDFYSPTDKTWLEPMGNMNAPPPPATPPKEGGKLEAGVKEEPGANFQMVTPDEKGNFYEGYTMKRVPKLEPKPPEPYCTFSETTSY